MSGEERLMPLAPTRVLLVTEFFPHRPLAVYGAIQRLRSHLSALRALGPVDVVFLWPKGYPSSRTTVTEWQESIRAAWGLDGRIWFVPVGLPRKAIDWVLDLVWACRGALSFFDQRPSMRTSGRRQASMLREVIRIASPSLIFAHRIGAGAALLRAGPHDRPVVLDLDDLEHVAMERLAAKSESRLKRYRGMFWSRLARLAESRIVATSACSLVCSELDRRKLLALCPAADIVVIPNSAVSFGDFPPAKGPTALFVGIAHYPPNREAILWLVAEIWPAVRATLPDARLLIVGEGSETLGVADPATGIETTGFLTDLAPAYREARLIVCPVQRGGGTRVKIIEAAINRRPVVSTTVGAEGLFFEAGSEILIADGATEFARLSIDLLSDPARAEHIGTAAQARARALYSRERAAELLQSVCRRVMGPPTTVRIP